MNSLCVLPYIGVATDSTGGWKPCVVFDQKVSYREGNINDYFSSKWLKNLKEQHLKNEYPYGCRICERKDNRKVESVRKRESDKFKNFEVNDSHSLKSIHIILSNLCNQACLMCTPKNSSLIYNETKKHLNDHVDHYRNIFSNLPNYTNSNLLNSYSNSDILDLIEKIDINATIHITGGEPTIHQQVFYFLNLLIEKKLNRSVTLNFNTNFQTCNVKFLNLLKKFKGLCVGSIDGIGHKGQFFRWNSNWKKINKNIKNFKKTCVNFDLTIAPTITILNVLYMNELVEWASIEKLKLRFNNQLVEPQFLSICNLPEYIKLELCKKYKDIDKHILNFENFKHHLFSNKTNKEIISYIITQLEINDKIRNSNFKKTLPELYNILINYEN